MKNVRKIFLTLGLVFASITSLVSCGNYICDYCGDKAVWKAQEVFLNEPMDDPVYVCAACKRDGKGPRARVSGDTIKWTHL